MQLGLHTYSLSAFGLAQAWSKNEHMPPWPRQLSTFQLFDRLAGWGLDGVQLDDAVLESLDVGYLGEVRAAAVEHGLFVEYDFSLDYSGWGIGIQHDLGEALDSAQAMGARVVKMSIDMDRPRPVMASRFHPAVMGRLEEIVGLLRRHGPIAEERGILIAVENHTDLFADELVWLLDRVEQPCVGACLDTMNAGLVLEDIPRAWEVLAPHALTNHFRDERVEPQTSGFRTVGTPLGQGDVDLRRAYELLRDHAPCDHITIQLDLPIPLDDREEALRLSEQGVVESVRYCREVLGLGREGRE